MIGLVSCSATKARAERPAAELYTSTLFRLSLAYARARCRYVYILSARWGLLELDDVVAPYDLALAELDRPAREAWAAGVERDLDARHVREDRILILAGSIYVDPLRTLLERQGRAVVEPLRGLQIGERLRILSRDAGTAVRELDVEGRPHVDPVPGTTKDQVVAAMVALDRGAP